MEDIKRTATPESLYQQAALLAADSQIAASLDAMRQLAANWTEGISPVPVHHLLARKLPIAEGRSYHQNIYLQLLKVDTGDGKLSANHARFWQFMSLRFFPTNPQGLMQFQCELSMILEELALGETAKKPILHIK